VAVVKAIMNQTYPVEEIIIADDGSTDDTLTALAELDYQAVKLLRLEHTGLPAVARNAGLAVATGDWIAFCDSDDYWLPERLARQIALHQPRDRALCTNAWAVSTGQATRLMFEKMPASVTLQDLLKENLIINSSVLIEKNLFKEVGGVASSSTLRGIEDYATWLRVSSLSAFHAVTEPLVEYSDEQIGRASCRERV
jgi:glycosyltransferase involved in cell wall biosynthesis